MGYNCYNFCHNPIFGGSAYISGTTCDGIETSVNLTFGDCACFDIDFPFVCCGNPVFSGACVPSSPTPTPSITPSITPTNTITPSITPTNTITPSITPTITPTCPSVNRYVAVGTDSYAVYGRDGITYSAASVWSGITVISDVDYYGGRMVAVGRNNSFNEKPIIYSDDYGLTWSPANTNFSGHCTAIATSGSLWVTCLLGAGVKTSTNGVDWTGSTITIPNATQRDITWNGSMFVGSGNLPIYSYDGLNWSAATYPSGFTDAQEAQYNGSRWVMVGNGNPKVIYSDNGTVWSASSISNSSTTITSNVSTVMWDGSKWFIAGAVTGSTNNRFAESTDGITFSGFSVTMPDSTGLSYGVDRMIYDGTKYMISNTTPGSMKPLHYSYDAITYSACTQPSGSTIDSLSLYSIPQPYLQPPVYNCGIVPTPSPTRTSTPTITPTQTATPGLSSTPTPTPSTSIAVVTPSVTPTLTTTPGNTPTITPTITPSSSNTPEPTSIPITPSVTPSITPSTSIPVTPSITPSVTPTLPEACFCYTLLNETGNPLEYSYIKCGDVITTNETLGGGQDVQICSSDLPVIPPGMTSTACTSVTNCTQDSDCTGCS